MAPWRSEAMAEKSSSSAPMDHVKKKSWAMQPHRRWSCWPPCPPEAQVGLWTAENVHHGQVDQEEVHGGVQGWTGADDHHNQQVSREGHCVQKQEGEKEQRSQPRCL